MAELADLRRSRVRHSRNNAGDGGAEGGGEAGAGGGDLSVFEGRGICRIDGGVEAVGDGVVVVLGSG